MPAIESIKQEDTKQQIIERLNAVPADKLRSVLDYVSFLSLGEDRKDCLLEPDHLTDQERKLVQEALGDPRPDVPHSEITKMLGM